MKKRIMILITGLVLILATGASAKGFGPGPDGKKGPFFEDLKLTAKQEDSLSRIRVEEMKKMIALRSKMEIARIEYKEIIKDKGFSTSKAKSQINKIVSIKSEMELNRLASIDATRKVLTADQWKIFSKRMGHKRFHRKGFGPDCGRRPHIPMPR